MSGSTLSGQTNAETLARVCQSLDLPDTADGDQVVGAIEDLQAAVEHAHAIAETAAVGWRSQQSARLEERAAIVRWLRDQALDRARWGEHATATRLDQEVDAIEAGEHLRGES